ncbi:MAG: response regulator transcription factor [Clostridiales bacterium]|nr:response regulator transcription factor [Clostridiales bacterium]
MDDLRVLIADDDPGMRLVLRKILGKVEGFTLIGEAQDGKAALEMADTLRPDILFLDVEMPEMTGIECARVVQDMNPATIIIFATAHDTYMGDAFEVYAFDYMVKPFKVERVMQTLLRARDVLSRRMPPEESKKIPAASPVIKGRMMLHHRGGISFVDLNDILLVQREDRTTVIYTADGGRYVTSDSLSDMEQRLPQDAFFRCHKSYIINLNHIKDISPYGRWTYVVRLEGIKQDALITHEKYDELENMFR